MSAPSKLSSTPSPLTRAALSAEATRKSEGESWDGAGSLAEPGNSRGSEDGWELSTWRSVVAGKWALRSALRIGAKGSRWAVVPITGLSEAEQLANEQTAAPTAQTCSIRCNTCHPTLGTAPP